MAELPFGNYRPFVYPYLSVGSCKYAYSGPYNEQCEFYHKEYHMGGYIPTCLNQDVFGWCECSRCSKNARRVDNGN